MSNRDEVVALLARKPGLTAREIGETLRSWTSDPSCAQDCLNFVRQGHISRTRVDGIFRYYPAGKAPRGDGEPAVPRGPKRREAVAAHEETAGEPDAVPAPRAAVNRPTVTADWLVFTLPGGAVAVVNKETQAGVRLDAATVAAIVEAANAAA